MPLYNNHSLFSLFFLTVLLSTSHSKGILDFQYTEYTQVLDSTHHQHIDLDFKPVQIPPSKLEFPEAYDLVNWLNEPLTAKQDHALSSDIDSYLNDMKSNFLRLLTLTQKLSNSEQKILHFESLINQTIPVQPEQQKLQQLQNYEQKLNDLTHKILQLDVLLRGNLSQIDNHPSNQRIGEVKQIEIDFKIDWLQQKIVYLRNFQQRVRLAVQSAGPEINYSEYFEDLQKHFNNEEGLISQIDLIIQKKDRLTQLRKDKVNLESSISALELYIGDIQQCNAEKENIRKEFKNHEKINQLIHELKELKKNEEPNIYCEGVVKKLTEKIKTMVRYYAIVASCASDLQPKIEDLRKEKERLQIVDEKIAELESVDNLQDFQKNYKGQKKIIDGMYSKIKDWKIKQFVHDPNKIAEIRQVSEEELRKATEQKNHMIEMSSGQPAQERRTLSNQIVELIKVIRRLKYQYGSIYQKYDSLANTLWSETYRFESQTNLKKKLLRMYQDERAAYEQMYVELMDLRTKIYESLS